MKKILLNGFLGLSLLFSACNPYESIHEQLKDDISLKIDSDAIPVEISLDSTYTTVDKAETSLVEYMEVTYPDANKFTEGKVVEIEYNLGSVAMSPSRILSNDDYKLTGNEFCKDVEQWNRMEEASDVAQEITLTDADYALVGDGKYKNFGYYYDKPGEYPKGVSVPNVLDAKVNHILNTNYSNQKGEVKVTYNYYNDNKVKPKTTPFILEKSTVCEYYFLAGDDINQKITTILNDVNHTELAGSEVRVEYSIEGTTHKDFFKKVKERWSKIDNASGSYYLMVEEDYKSMGLDFFSSSRPQSAYLPQFLSIKYTYAKVAEAKRVIYNYYKNEEIVEYTFDGTTWNQTAPINTTVRAKSKVKYTDGKWIISKATVVKLADADYELVGDGKYHNFGYYYNKAGEYPEGTDVDNILVAKIEHILTTNYPDLNIEDAEVIVVFKYYNNGINMEKITLLFKDGKWGVTESTIELK